MARLDLTWLGQDLTTMHLPAGSTITIVDRAGTPFVDAAGGHAGALGLVTDVTKRKGAEAALRQSEERLRLALAAARMDAWDWDLRTCSLHWSAEEAVLYDLPAAQLALTVDVAIENYIHPEDHAMVREVIKQSVETGGEHEVEFRVQRPV